jgi:hypothetical protein
MQTLDYVKRGLDDVLDGFRDKTTGRLPSTNEVHSVKATLGEFRDELKRLNPDYAQALETAGDYLSANEAFDRGAQMFKDPNLPEADYAKWFGGLSEADKKSAIAGIANQAYDLKQNNRLNARSYLTPRKAAKLEISLGPDQAAKFVRNLQAEREMAGFSQGALSARGSPTPGALSESALQDQYAGNRVGEEVVGRLESGHGIGGAYQMFNRRLGVGLRKLGVAGNPDVLDEQGRLLMSKPEDLARALRAIETSRRATPRVSFVPPGLAPTLAAALRNSGSTR